MDSSGVSGWWAMGDADGNRDPAGGDCDGDGGGGEQPARTSEAATATAHRTFGLTRQDFHTASGVLASRAPRVRVVVAALLT